MARTSAQSLVRQVLRDAGTPLSIDEVIARLTALQPINSRNPRQTVTNALGGDPLCESTGDGLYAYFPTLLRGAEVRLTLELAAPERELLGVSAEVHALLWPLETIGDLGPAPTLTLDDGPVISLNNERRPWRQPLLRVLALPAPFWQWWKQQQQAGNDALLLRCEDAEAGRVSVRGIRSGSLDLAAVKARNEVLLQTAAGIVKCTRGVDADTLARRLLARGIYHQHPAPDPLANLLLDPAGPFCVEHGLITYRPELTPALRRVFATRIVEEQDWDEQWIREELGLALLPDPGALLSLSGETAQPPQLLQLKVRLSWKRSIWRIIEIVDTLTLDDLHYAIQHAFGWDDDHLYAFFLSGHAWDPLTSVGRPFPGQEESPTGDQVVLADLEFQPGQRFLYIFDFGDQLGHDIEVLARLPAPGRMQPPRVVESHGEAPPQYETWDEDEYEESPDGDDPEA